MCPVSHVSEKTENERQILRYGRRMHYTDAIIVAVLADESRIPALERARPLYSSESLNLGNTLLNNFYDAKE